MRISTSFRWMVNLLDRGPPSTVWYGHHQFLCYLYEINGILCVRYINIYPLYLYNFKLHLWIFESVTGRWELGWYLYSGRWKRGPLQSTTNSDASHFSTWRYDLGLSFNQISDRFPNQIIYWSDEKTFQCIHKLFRLAFIKKITTPESGEKRINHYQGFWFQCLFCG